MSEKQFTKVIVLNDAYFPSQKLSLRFSSAILQHMEMEDKIQPHKGMQFGIVQRMERSLRSNARTGTICEVTDLDYTQ